MKNTLAQKHRRRLEAGITTRIKQLQYFKKQLHLVDEKIFSAGMDLFESAPILALWLCEPAQPAPKGTTHLYRYLRHRDDLRSYAVQ